MQCVTVFVRVENKHAIYIKNFCYADSWTRNPIKKRIKLQMPKIKNQLWQQVRLAHNYQTHTPHTHSHTHMRVYWPFMLLDRRFLQQFACQLKLLAIRYFDCCCCCSCSSFAASISCLSLPFSLCALTLKSLRFNSFLFPFFRFTLLWLQKFQVEREIHKKKRTKHKANSKEAGEKKYGTNRRKLKTKNNKRESRKNVAAKQK